MSVRARWENPVVRHALRLGTHRGWQAIVLVLLGCGVAVGALIERHWMEMEEYSLLQPSAISRTLATTLLGLTVIVLPWAAVRGTLLWRRIRTEGLLDEYRRTHLSPAAITTGVLWAALFPVAVLIGLSLLITAAVAWFTRGLLISEVVTAHALLAAQAVAFGALGLWLGSWIRLPGLAIVISLGVLALVTLAIWLIDPYYRSMKDPTPWIYGALLPNPVTATGNALNTDVLRFSWIYERIHAHEYFFLYPPAWQTGGLYLTAALVFALLVSLRTRRPE